MKYLLLGLLAYVGWRWYVGQRAKGAPTMPAPPVPPASAGGTAEKMVSCAHCGIHLPQSEAVGGARALHFCSDDHRRQYDHQDTF